MAKIITFPLTLRSSEKRPRKKGIEIIAFPFGRRRQLVERHVQAIRALKPDQAESYLDKVLDGICSDLRAIGIACEDCECEALLEFLGAVGRELHGPGFVLEPEEAAR